MKKIRVTYEGPIDMKFDKKITDALKKVGFEWTGQGTETKTGIRDIGFEYKAKKSKKKKELQLIEEGKGYRLVRNA